MPWSSLGRVVGGLSVVAMSACSFSDAGESTDQMVMKSEQIQGWFCDICKQYQQLM